MSDIEVKAGRPRFNPDHAGLPDIVAHAAHCLQHPEDRGALATLADHVMDVTDRPGHWPEEGINADGGHAVAHHFMNWVMNGTTVSEIGKHLKMTPHVGVTNSQPEIERGVKPYLEIRPNHRLGGKTVPYSGGDQEITDEQRAMPKFRRTYGAPSWDVMEYRPGRVAHSFSSTELRNTRRKASSYAVAAELFRHGGVPNLLHGVMANFHFQPGRDPRGADRGARFTNPPSPPPETEAKSMTDEDALRAAVVARPHDWTPRLVLADYLDDTGEPHHAEEAARIRQAADPSTPLGRAVAASRRAWHITGSGPAVAKRPTALLKAVDQLHTVLHGPDAETRRYGLMDMADYHWWHSDLHYHAADRAFRAGQDDTHHRDARAAHSEAYSLLGEYARTL